MDFYLLGLSVYFDNRHVGRTRGRAIIRIIKTSDLKSRLHILGQASQPAVRSLGDLTKRDVPLGFAAHEDVAVLNIKVSRIRLQEMTSDPQRLLSQRASCQDCCPAGEHRAAPRVGPGAVWGDSRVTTNDTHILQWHP